MLSTGLVLIGKHTCTLWNGTSPISLAIIKVAGNTDQVLTYDGAYHAALLAAASPMSAELSRLLDQPSEG